MKITPNSPPLFPLSYENEYASQLSETHKAKDPIILTLKPLPAPRFSSTTLSLLTFPQTLPR
jgi:hypothetical protein